MRRKNAVRTKHYGFRLDPMDENERRVIEEIAARIVPDEIGVREIVTASILAFIGKPMPPSPTPNRVVLRQLRAVLTEFQDVLGEARTFYAQAPQETPEYHEQEQRLQHRLMNAVQGMISPAKSYDGDDTE